MPIALGPFPHPSYDTTAGRFLSPSPAAPCPRGWVEIYGVFQHYSSPIVEAKHDQEFCEAPLQNGLAFERPKLWGHWDVLPRLLSSKASHKQCTLPLCAQHLLWATEDAKSSLPPSHFLGSAGGKGLQSLRPNPDPVGKQFLMGCRFVAAHRWLVSSIWLPGRALVLIYCVTK